MASGQLEGDVYVVAAREYAELEPVAIAAKQVRRLRAEVMTLDEMAKGTDPELREMAVEELQDMVHQMADAEQELAIKLLPRDMADDRPAMLEIRAGTGGDEAGLFAGDLFRMYSRYAENMGWKVELISASSADVGGFKEVVASINGVGVFAKLKFESGVHRVQRVPVTESGGRIHTSAATVAVLPEPTEVDVHIEARDLKIDVYRASGAGGQHVNTTDSAVRITHLPSGVVVSCQNQRSQIQNRAKAMIVLKAKLAERARDDREAKLANITGPQKDAAWGNQIRSYVLAPYQMVKDLRTNHETGKVDTVLGGDVDEFMEAWLRWRRTPDAGA